MGNNDAFRYFEETVITIYDLGVLNYDVLTAFASQFKGTDIDTGGSQDLKSKDGKDIAQICVEVIDPTFEPTCFDTDDTEAWNWWDRFESIRYNNWGWR